MSYKYNNSIVQEIHELSDDQKQELAQQAGIQNPEKIDELFAFIEKIATQSESLQNTLWDAGEEKLFAEYQKLEFNFREKNSDSLFEELNIFVEDLIELDKTEEVNL